MIIKKSSDKAVIRFPKGRALKSHDKSDTSKRSLAYYKGSRREYIDGLTKIGYSRERGRIMIPPEGQDWPVIMLSKKVMP